MLNIFYSSNRRNDCKWPFYLHDFRNFISLKFAFKTSVSVDKASLIIQFRIAKKCHLVAFYFQRLNCDKLSNFIFAVGRRLHQTLKIDKEKKDVVNVILRLKG